MVVIGGSIVALMALARQAPAPTGPLPTVGPTASLASDGVVPPATAGITFPDFAVDAEVVRSPTTSTAQSKLWFAQGKWWGALFGPTTNRLGIFALDPATHVWADTGTLIDERPIADADVLWDGTHLYVVSGGSRPSENHAIRMRRFTYDAGSKRYAMDPDFPVTIRPTGASPAVLAKDSTDVLWVAYTADDKVWLSHTLEQATLWSPPVALDHAGGGDHAGGRRVGHRLRSGSHRGGVDEPALRGPFQRARRWRAGRRLVARRVDPG